MPETVSIKLACADYPVTIDIFALKALMRCYNSDRPELSPIVWGTLEGRPMMYSTNGSYMLCIPVEQSPPFQVTCISRRDIRRSLKGGSTADMLATLNNEYLYPDVSALFRNYEGVEPFRLEPLDKPGREPKQSTSFASDLCTYRNADSMPCFQDIKYDGRRFCLDTVFTTAILKILGACDVFFEKQSSPVKFTSDLGFALIMTRVRR